MAHSSKLQVFIGSVFTVQPQLNTLRYHYRKFNGVNVQGLPAIFLAGF